MDYMDEDPNPNSDLLICLAQARYAVKAVAAKEVDDPHYKSAMEKSAANIRAAEDVIRAQDKEIDDLRHKMRMIGSHASGGCLQDINLTTNQIAVEITRHVNRVWERAKEVGAEEALKARDAA